ncbi:MAG: nuclear transport factor 2 family protein [Candidatus Acidiferrales bacterium]
MKQLMAGAIISMFSLLGASGFAQQKSQAGGETEQVWAQEEAYWRIVKNHDAKAWADLWSEDFVGWPFPKEHPVDKAEGVKEFKSGAMFSSAVIAYELQRESVEMHGVAVITFYRVKERLRDADGSESTHTARLSHTWMKRGGRWVIVGGMSAIDPPPAANSAGER